MKGCVRDQSPSIDGGSEVLIDPPSYRPPSQTCPGHSRRGSDGIVSPGRVPRNPAGRLHIHPCLSDSQAGALIPEPRTGPPPNAPQCRNPGQPFRPEGGEVPPAKLPPWRGVLRGP